MNSTTVLVTGANGYIAQHLVKQLLAKSYKVIGQVRSDDKGKSLAKVVDDANFSYVVVPVLEEKGAFDKVLKDHPEIDTIYHTATPVSFADEEVEKNILIPAINGTKYILDSIAAHAPQLKHFVYTSSIVAQIHPAQPSMADEDTWSPLSYEDAQANGLLGYSGSKKYAEKEVWKFRDEHKPKFTVATVLPAFVLGPQAYEANITNLTSTSAMFADAISSKTREELESKLMLNIGVDVRDVARAHIFGAENASADGKRLLLVSGSFSVDTILTAIADKFPGKTSIKPNDPPAPAGPNFFDTKRTVALLGEFITPTQSIYDAVEQHAAASAKA